MDEFWKNNVDKVLVGVITAIVVLLLSEPIKAAFKKIGTWLDGFFQSLGFGFQKRYYRALTQSHQWLKLIGIYNPSDLHAPRLKEVYVSLRLNTAKKAPTVVWNRMFNDSEKHIVVLGGEIHPARLPDPRLHGTHQPLPAGGLEESAADFRPPA